MLKRENVAFLNQLASSLEKAQPKLEEAYQNKSYEEFNKVKKFILSIQQKVLEGIE